MAGLTETLKILITGEAAPAIRAFQETGSASEALAAKTTLTGKAMSKLGIEGASTSAILSKAAPVAAGIAAVGLAKWALDGAEKFADLAGQVRQFQRVSGASAEDSSRLTFAVKELGIQPEAASLAFGRLGTRLGTGKADLASYGVEVAHNKDGSVNLAQTVSNLSEAFQSEGNQIKKNALANEAFGRSWQVLSPLLNRGKSDLKQLFDEAAKDHQVLSQEDLDRTLEFSLATKELHSAMTGLQIEVGKEVVPALTTLAKVTTVSLQTLDGVQSGVGGFVEGLTHIADGAIKAGSGIGGFASSAVKVGIDSIPVVGTIHQIGDALGDVTGLFDSGGESSNKFGDAQDRVKEATKNLANTLADHNAKASDVTAAQHEMTAASQQLHDMQGQLEGSLTKTNTALQSQADKAFAASQADVLFASDKLALENATINVTKAYDSWRSALHTGTAATDENSVAGDKLRDSHQALVGAVIQVITVAGKKAADDLTGASQADKQAASTKAQKSALQELERQYPFLAAAVGDYFKYLDKAPTHKKTKVEVDTDEAHRELDRLERRIQKIVGGKYEVKMQVSGG